MNTELLREIAENAAFLLSLSIVYEVSYIIPKKYEKIRPYVNGLLIGLIGMVIMSLPFVLSPGIVFDSRSILISVTGLTFGLIPTLITVLITSVYRLLLGGVGAIPGIAVIITSAAMGLFWHRYFLKHRQKHRLPLIFLFGIVTHVIMLACMLLLPYPTSINVIREIALPVLLVFPIGSVLLSYLLIRQKERNELLIKTVEVEAQLRHQQKLEAIGTLAGGVAHEINNPIFGIINYAQLVLDDTDPESVHAQYLRGIINESGRVSEIVRGLLQFSRQDKQSHSYARIDDIINQTVSLVRTLVRKDQIDLQLDIEADLPEIKCRSQQIQQVLMNLLTNARDAVNEKYPDFNEDKIIRLSCRQYIKDDHRWIHIIVEDHGCGITSDVRQKMFEPFFSTKPKEKGTGLGLSISFGIVHDHHGYFEVETKIDRFTTFHLHLPVDNGWSH